MPYIRFKATTSSMVDLESQWPIIIGYFLWIIGYFKV